MSGEYTGASEEARDLTYGGGWQKIMMILASPDVSEAKVNEFQHGVFIIKNGVNTLVDSIGWGNEASFFADFEQTAWRSMHASGFEDEKGKPIRPSKLRYLYEGALSYSFRNAQGQRDSVHARLTMVLKPTIDSCPSVTIAKRSESLTTLQSMVDNGTMNKDIAEFLRRAVITKQSIIFSAGTGCGKTTMLRACGNYFDPMERVVVAEDAPELQFSNVKDCVYLQSTPWRPGMSKNDEVTLSWCVAIANRMRMQRLIVGECRGSEIHGWLNASSSGVRGGMSTFHANSPQECLDRISMLDSEAEPGRDVVTINKGITYALDFVIQLGKDNQGHHWVEKISEISKIVAKDTGMISTADIFEHVNGGFRNMLNQMSDEKRREMGYM